MKPSRMIGLAIGAILASKAAIASETIVVRNVLGPEGPLFVDGNLYYVSDIRPNVWPLHPNRSLRTASKGRFLSYIRWWQFRDERHRFSVGRRCAAISQMGGRKAMADTQLYAFLAEGIRSVHRLSLIHISEPTRQAEIS